MSDTVKIVRLNSGEDVIASLAYSANSSFTTLNNPMSLIFKRTAKGTVMMMVPWLPIEVINDNIATIHNNEILTTIEPKNDLIEYYGHMVDYALKSALTNDDIMDNIREEILALKEQDDIDMDDETDMQVEEVINHINEVRKRKLH